jgi:hypothetical protein
VSSALRLFQKNKQATRIPGMLRPLLWHSYFSGIA